MSVGLVEIIMVAAANGCIGVAARHGDDRVRRSIRHYGASVTGGGVAMRLKREREKGGCVCECIRIHNSYLTVIGMHEMHGRMHPNYCQITILLAVDLCSSSAYFMMTQPLPIAGKTPINTLVARHLHVHV